MVNIQKLWKITMFKGKTHYFDWAMFNSYVKLPKGSKGYVCSDVRIFGPLQEEARCVWCEKVFKTHVF